MKSELKLKRLREHQTSADGDQITLSLPAPKSPTGKVQRFCPSTECHPRTFQMGDNPRKEEAPGEKNSLSRRLPGARGCTCPYCGCDAEDDEFTSPKDLEAATDFVKWAFEEDVGDWMEDMAKDFNRKVGRGSFISMNMTVKRAKRPRPYPFREDLLRALACDLCGREYGVYALALFCPDCGGRNVHVHFRRELELVARQVAMADEAEQRGEVELAYRLLGNAHEDVLTAFETYLKLIHRFLARRRFAKADAAQFAKRNGGNTFQNVEKAKRAFSELHLAPFDVLEPAEEAHLRLQIEKRHVIGHNLGLADDKYIRLSGQHEEGENVTVLGEDVVRFGGIAFKVVVSGLEEVCPEFAPLAT